jgi:hypothetical protein
MQQPATLHGVHPPDALDALAGLLSRAEVSKSSNLTAVVSMIDHDPPTLTRLAEELPDWFTSYLLPLQTTFTMLGSRRHL